MIIRSKNAPEIYTREQCFITELLNSAEVGSLSVARARVESGITTELHRLNVDEAYYILEGEGSMQINNQPANDVDRGDIVFIPQGSSQQITNTGPEDLVFLCICTPRFTQEVYVTVDSGK